jgi:hypothetical protein
MMTRGSVADQPVWTHFNAALQCGISDVPAKVGLKARYMYLNYCPKGPGVQNISHMSL